MSRPHSRGEIRKRAAMAFARRNREQHAALRTPDAGETPLSADEVLHGVRRGLIGTRYAPEAAEQQQ